jgi:hypothetical protein
MTTTRRLCAILAADMAGCSRLTSAANSVQQPPSGVDRAAGRMRQGRHAVAAKWLQNSPTTVLTH